MTIMETVDQNIINGKKTKKKKNNKKVKQVKKEKKEPVLRYKILSFILIVLTVLTIISLVVDDLSYILYMIPIVFACFIICFILNKNKLKRWIKRIFSFFAFLFVVFDIFMLLFGSETVKFIAGLMDSGYRVETYGIYVLENNKYNELSDIKDKIIGYIEDENNENVNKALKKLDKKISYKSKSVNTLSTLINSLIDGEVDAILMEVSYEEVLREQYPEKIGLLKSIDTLEVINFVNTIKSDVNISKDSFVVYISGIDTSGNVASKARSDVNLLLAVNPNTNNILMINTPRDYYVNLATKNKKDKLTHVGLFGVEESLKTLSDLYDVDIDFYVRINFTSFIKIVDALDGINVNVPLNFCEQNSKRSKKAGDLICLKKGNQTLNGEQALALARHRKTILTGDRGRGENQMLVLEAIINKAMSPKILTKYNSIIDALKGRVTTNMEVNQLIGLAKKQIKQESTWTFTSINANGTDSIEECSATGVGKAYVMKPDSDSVDKIKSALNQLFAGEKEISVN